MPDNQEAIFVKESNQIFLVFMHATGADACVSAGGSIRKVVICWPFG